MIQAFNEIGYQVDVVSGNATERKKIIKIIKSNIKKGIKYDFLYSESSTMPTLLTEKHHFPTHPFLDFGFFRYCKKHNINIGLFYRDIYWKFPQYKENLPFWKSFFAIKFYQHDLKEYGNLLNKLYLPSWRVYQYIKSSQLDKKTDILPPACEQLPIPIYEKAYFKDFNKKPLEIFYVGGIGAHYGISELMSAVHKMKKCRLTICCREDEWEREKEKLEIYLTSNNIQIIHKNNQELEEYYNRADVCSLLFKPHEYMKLAIPYKAFEYLAHLKPMIASRDTEISDFVMKNDIGWVVPYNEDSIQTLLNDILKEPEIIIHKSKNLQRVRDNNTWIERAKKVAFDLQ